MDATVRRRDPEGRRNDLLRAAASVFAAKGVTGATVSDIVRAAGVAQGTFYLYFPTKDAVTDALIAQIADGLMASLGSAASAGSAVDRLLAIRDVFTAEVEDPELRALIEFLHAPANEDAHRRMAERLLGRLAALMEHIVEQGVAEGSFHVEDVRIGAWFVLSGMQGIERAQTPPDEMPAAMATVTSLALRALGYEAADGR